MAVKRPEEGRAVLSGRSQSVGMTRAHILLELNGYIFIDCVHVMFKLPYFSNTVQARGTVHAYIMLSTI